MRTTSKTMIKLLGGADGKAGRFFVMKRATGGIVSARFFERYAFIDDINDINAIEQLLNKAFRDQSSTFTFVAKKSN